MTTNRLEDRRLMTAEMLEGIVSRLTTPPLPQSPRMHQLLLIYPTEKIQMSFVRVSCCRVQRAGRTALTEPINCLLLGLEIRVSVNHGCSHRCMAKQLLYCSYVRACLQEPSGPRVTKGMKPDSIIMDSGV